MLYAGTLTCYFSLDYNKTPKRSHHRLGSSRSEENRRGGARRRALEDCVRGLCAHKYTQSLSEPDSSY